MSETKRRKKDGGYFMVNDRATGNQPGYRGKATINDKEFLVSVWQKKTPDGKDMFTFELTDPNTLPPRPSNPGQPPAPSSAAPASPGAPAPRAPAPAAPTPPNENQAFDDIFGGDGSQW